VTHLSVASKAAKPSGQTGHHFSAMSLSIISSLATKLARQQFEIEDATVFRHNYATGFPKGTLVIFVKQHL
jgi:hypothetical protein